MKYGVSIEIDGNTISVGSIVDGRFSYSDEYLKVHANQAISISLPARSGYFSELQTKAFFEGLLPEGFSRTAVAQYMQVPTEDYISILAGLGKECIGAIQITDDFNNTTQAEYIKLSIEEVKALAAEGASKSAEIITQSHLSLAGASGKVGLYYDEKSRIWYQPLGSAPSTHIVKQSHIRLSGIVINEMLCMRTAKKCGITVPDCFIINTGKNDDSSILFATKRYDRCFSDNAKILNGLKVPSRLHQEDFAQALGIISTNKYEQAGDYYLQKCFELIKNNSMNPLEDQLQFWNLLIFNYLIGNTDNHLKNHTFIYNSSLSGLKLAPAYDIVSTCIYKTCTRHLAMKIGDAQTLDEVNRQAFEEAAQNIGLGRTLALKNLDKMLEKFRIALDEASDELANEGFIEAIKIRNEILKTGGIAKYK